jgi:hypothetical protein
MNHRTRLAGAVLLAVGMTAFATACGSGHHVLSHATQNPTVSADLQRAEHQAAPVVIRCTTELGAEKPTDAAVRQDPVHAVAGTFTQLPVITRLTHHSGREQFATCMKSQIGSTKADEAKNCVASAVLNANSMELLLPGEHGHAARAAAGQAAFECIAAAIK